jgi:16S rRNA (adenine1518-N6/adenine1519-N6)-dimethyltransferase
MKGPQSEGVRAKKHLGQHFLHDGAVARRIAQAAPAGRAVEIGPGTGALTRPLLERGDVDLWAIEVDAESAAYLRTHTDGWGEDRVMEGDFLVWHPDTAAGLAGQSFNVLGNFPYNISTQILFRVLDLRDRIPGVTGMFQKEVAERVCAPHGSRTYGILSVLLQTYYDARYLFTVGPGAFTPPPKVDSGVLELRRADRDPGVPYPHLLAVVKAAFNQRRKTLRNALRAGGYSIDLVPEDVLSRRAEQLSPGDFAELARLLERRSAT